jgi:anaerobic selenocysteine-containing dehydrogenase
VNQEFVKAHVNFKPARPTSATACAPTTLEKDAKFNGYPGADGKPKNNPNDAKPITFDEFKKFVSDLHAGQHRRAFRRAQGAPAKLAELYADPKVKVVSFWTMGFNQHTRGTWVNNMIYNVHLLVGKISTRATALLAHRPALRLRHGARSGHLRPPPAGRHGGDQPRAPSPHRRDLAAAGRHHPRQDRPPRRGPEPRPEGRQAQVLLDQHHQQHAGRAQRQPGDLPGLAQPGGLRGVSDVYPPSRPWPPT